MGIGEKASRAFDNRPKAAQITCTVRSHSGPMQILTTGKNLDIGDALRRRIETRLTGNLAKYFDGTVRAHVVVELQKSRFHTECTLHLSTGLTLQARGRDIAANSSFDRAAERLEKQLRRYKRRLRDYPPERLASDLTGE